MASQNNFIINDGILTKYVGQDSIVAIPDCVTEIGPYAFAENHKIESVVIPDGVICIKRDAFARCSNLLDIEIPGSVRKIGDEAFLCCNGLRSVTMLYGVEEIGEYAFAGCDQLRDIAIPDSVTLIAPYAFEGCYSLSSVKIPQGVPFLGDHVFYECVNLRSVCIPSSVKKVCRNAFCRCASLTSVTLPEGVEFVGHGVFFECTSLKTVTLPRSLKLMGEDVFSRCDSLQKIVAKCSLHIIHPEKLWRITVFDGQKVQIENKTSEFEVQQLNAEEGLIVGYRGKDTNPIWPEHYNGLKITGISIRKKTKNLTKIETLALPEGYQRVGGFSGSTALKKVVLPESLTTIQNRAFAGCWNLEEVVIYDNVFYIGDEAFSGCVALRQFTLPARLQEKNGEFLNGIGKRIFKGSGLGTLYVNSEHLDPADTDLLRECTDYTIYAPKGSAFFATRPYKRHTVEYKLDPLASFYDIVVKNNWGPYIKELRFNRSKKALTNVMALFYVTKEGLQDQPNDWTFAAQNTEIKAFNNRGVLMGVIQYEQNIEEIMRVYRGRVENFRFKKKNLSKETVRSMNASCLFDIVFERLAIPACSQEKKEPNCAETKKLAGMNIVVTGDLMRFPEPGPYPQRTKLRLLIESLGGRLTDSVSSKTTVLVTNFPNSGTTKIKKAKELGIEIISEEEFVRRYLTI